MSTVQEVVARTTSSARRGKKSKKPDRRPARSRYWATRKLEQNKVRRLLRQKVYDRIEIREGRHAGMKKRVGEPKPRFASKQEARDYWRANRQRMGRLG